MFVIRKRIYAHPVEWKNTTGTTMTEATPKTKDHRPT